MSTKQYPPVSPGTTVRTTQPNLSFRHQWTDEGWAMRKWDVKGEVITHHDSHGLCYDIRHEDGTEGCYDPSEFEELKPNAVNRSPSERRRLELRRLVRKWKEELTYRDGGATAKKTWIKIKRIATLEQQVKFLEKK